MWRLGKICPPCRGVRGDGHQKPLVLGEDQPFKHLFPRQAVMPGDALKRNLALKAKPGVHAPGVLVLALRPPGGLSGCACFRHGFRLSKSYTVTAIVKLLRRNDKGAVALRGNGMDTAASPVAPGVGCSWEIVLGAQAPMIASCYT